MAGQLALMLAKSRILKASVRVIACEVGWEPSPHSDDESAYAWEQLALAARELVEITDGLEPKDQPIGWDK